MRVTIIRDDGVVGVDGVFRSVDLSTLPGNVRAVQWNGSTGHIEHDEGGNTPLDDFASFQSFIDLWNGAAPVVIPPTPAEMKAAAHARINAAYVAAVNDLTAGYPETEIASWPKQEVEARAYLADEEAETPWLRGAAAARGINVPNFAALVVRNADALAPLHGGLTGRRQRLRDAIDALGDAPTQEQLDAIVWLQEAP